MENRSFLRHLIKLSFLLQMLLTLVLAACGELENSGSKPANLIEGESSDGRGDAPTVRGGLLSATSVTILEKEEIRAAFAAAGYGSDAAHAVEVFRISYRSIDPFGAPATASGIVMLPFGVTDAPLVTANPVLAVASAKGVYDMGGLLFASAGYVTLLPDYPRFDSSADPLRPYLHADSYATVTVDMLRACLDFCAEKGLPLNGQLFLHGYSEGGYATLAVQRCIESDLSHEFRVTASAPMAGPYELSQTLRESIAQENLSVLFPVILCLCSYNRIYDLKILEKVFQPQPLALIDAGLAEQSSVEELVSMGYARVFRPEFLASYLGKGELLLKEAVEKNDLGPWKPAAPVRLFHCVNDEMVPFSNSVQMYESFLSLGADNVTLEARDYGNHAGCYPQAILEVKMWFDELKKI